MEEDKISMAWVTVIMKLKRILSHIPSAYQLVIIMLRIWSRKSVRTNRSHNREQFLHILVGSALSLG